MGSHGREHGLGWGGLQQLTSGKVACGSRGSPWKVCPQHFQNWGSRSIKGGSSEHISVPNIPSYIITYHSSTGSVNSRQTNHLAVFQASQVQSCFWSSAPPLPSPWIALPIRAHFLQVSFQMQPLQRKSFSNSLVQKTSPHHPWSPYPTLFFFITLTTI